MPKKSNEVTYQVYETFFIKAYNVWSIQFYCDFDGFIKAFVR